jgi:2-polyprenyl-6-methoxyphenol hydroxylase-like FAD-dependent oxidoreductase
MSVTGKRALIIGGSTGGLLAGHFLRTIGWDVTIFERSVGDLADRGAGLGTQPPLFEAMRAIGVPFDETHGVAIDHCATRFPTSATCADAASPGLNKTAPASPRFSRMARARRAIS